MKKIIIVLVAAALAGGGWYAYKNKKGSRKPRYATAQAELKDLSEVVDTTGVVAPENRVEIQPSSSGRIEEILVEEGEAIKAGEVLALMSSSDRVAILDAARASGDDQYKQWKETYKPIKIISPISGTLILRNVVEGQTVNSGTVLFALSDKLIVAASLDESDIGRVRQGQQASIVLDSYPDKTVQGTVFKILDEGTTKNNVVTYTVKLRPDHVPPFFRSQMTANIKIRISQRKNILLLPGAAVTTTPQGETAVIKELKDGQPVYAKVETGQSEGDLVEIVSGLAAGETVYYQRRSYSAQVDSAGKNPLMPSRPNVSRQQQRAISGH
ncbi:MAG TPA: efflux RND transporter periplasmic adaptor subunit [Elusimicrobiales bacterium]|nr:efflux RND transporter periplasmic adaptor subunit [Elusimicrobiales bacterium]